MNESIWIFSNYGIKCKYCNQYIYSSPTKYCPNCGSKMINYNYSKCDCYHTEYGKPQCWGTKERDVCKCNGDILNCDFY